ncbi:MAG: ATP-binding protein [Oscillospiraceae bacterium]|nr:ATP-binding protein [Oscillospiraceae bacterium]
MPLDGKLLSRAREHLNENKQARETAFREHRNEVYAKFPRLEEIDLALRETVATIVQLAVGDHPDLEARLRELGATNQALQAESRDLLVQNGYPSDYLDDPPACAVCNDNGHYAQGLCTCLLDIYRTLQAQELSDLLNISQENFEAFSLDYYDDRALNPRFGTTARENMAMILALCQTYAAQFGPGSMNLFLTGAPGLGKTFLSSCIAKVVSESGFSVVYDTATGLFAKFEAEKFGPRHDHEAAHDEVERYLNCDLLILDDLGTEMTTTFTISALYTLINTRLLRKKSTIINSNFSLPDLAAKYNLQIMSRLEGEYELVTFFGNDIRKLKKEF